MYLPYIPQNITLEQKCAHFCSKVVYCGVWDRCIVDSWIWSIIEASRQILSAIFLYLVWSRTCETIDLSLDRSHVRALYLSNFPNVTMQAFGERLSNSRGGGGGGGGFLGCELQWITVCQQSECINSLLVYASKADWDIELYSGFFFVL